MASPTRRRPRRRLAEDAAAIDALQDRLFAEGKRALLVVLQGIDCSGKDGTVRAVFNPSGPLGVRVAPFKAPTVDELAQDYLWRVHMACPPGAHRHLQPLALRGRAGGEGEGLCGPEAIERRYDEINAFEKMLADNGTTILKFMLHISKEEQAERLQERLDDAGEALEVQPRRPRGPEAVGRVQAAYETTLERCSTAHAPWHVIPADRNWVRNAAIARIVRETLEEMNPQYPEPKGWDPAKIKIE